MTSWIIKVRVGLIRARPGLVGKEGRKLRQEQFEKRRPRPAAVHSLFLSQLHSCRIDNSASIYPWPLLYFRVQCMFIWHICYKRIYIGISNQVFCEGKNTFTKTFWTLLASFSRAVWVNGATYFVFMSCVFPWRHYNTSSSNMENMQSSQQM